MEDNKLRKEDTEYIEREFAKMEASRPARSPRSKATGIRDVLQYMLDHIEKTWWWSWELNDKVNSKGGFLSHRACARASDLALHHSDLVEDRRVGRFKVYRLKVENWDKINEFLRNK